MKKLMIAPGLMLATILPLLVIADSCEQTGRVTSGDSTTTQITSTVITEFRGQNYLITVKHDGHQFVVVSDGNHANAIIHHPSCPCINRTDK